MDITIREYEQADLPALLALWNGEIGNHYDLESLTRRMALMAGNDAYHTYVALSHRNVIGFITTVHVLSCHSDTGYLKINGLAVNRAFQRMGVGTALMDYVERRAASEGVVYMMLCSGMQRTGAHEFYKKRGYGIHSYCITKSLEIGE